MIPFGKAGPPESIIHEHGSMEKTRPGRSNVFRLILAIVIANAIRLIRIIPNNDPIMSMALPYSRRSSALTSFAFPFITMASFDVLTGFGPWTIVTAGTYGLIGLAFHFLLKDRKRMNIQSYMRYGVAGVLVFDFVTGVVATPFLYGGTFEQSLIGQIPFTILHLLSTSLFILIVTPLLDKEVLLNKRLSDSGVRRLFVQVELAAGPKMR